jgi:D-arabinose 1-dehydrogenase-like Zn-dependent alcohol dehydrogenase
MIEETLSLAARHRIVPVIQPFPLSQVNEAIRQLRANRIRYRAVIHP